MPIPSATPKKKKPLYKRTWFIIVASIVVLFILIKIFHHKKSAYELVPVKRGAITETVSVTGNTTPVQSVSLGFQNGGTISSVSYDVGAHVYPGTVIASLNTSDLFAQLKQAQADVDTQKARLSGLQSGAQPEDIAVSQASVAKAQQDLANIYAGISDASRTAYASATDAVRTQLSPFFKNANTSEAEFAFSASNSDAAGMAAQKRIAINQTFTSWQNDLASISETSSPDDLTTLAQNEIAHLKDTQALIATVSTVLNTWVDQTPAQLASDKSAVNVATNEVNAAITSLNTIMQNIASENITITQLKAQLALKQAGSTTSDLAAQEAQVEASEASVASVQAKLASSEIVSPISGVITEQNAKIGQVASPGSSLVSIISDGKFEVDAQVPETDVGKLAVGNVVNMTFDAFSGETFTGKVFYIDPAETIESGVVDYKIKVSFDTADARMKSGLTANLDIVTKENDSTLILPQYAILVNDNGAFVETLDEKGAVVTTPVTLGIQDENGNAEILTGVTEGENVLNIGLKQAS